MTIQLEESGIIYDYDDWLSLTFYSNSGRNMTQMEASRVFDKIELPPKAFLVSPICVVDNKIVTATTVSLSEFVPSGVWYLFDFIKDSTGNIKVSYLQT